MRVRKYLSIDGVFVCLPSSFKRAIFFFFFLINTAYLFTYIFFLRSHSTYINPKKLISISIIDVYKRDKFNSAILRLRLSILFL